MLILQGVVLLCWLLSRMTVFSDPRQRTPAFGCRYLVPDSRQRRKGRSLDAARTSATCGGSFSSSPARLADAPRPVVSTVRQPQTTQQSLNNDLVVAVEGLRRTAKSLDATELAAAIERLGLLCREADTDAPIDGLHLELAPVSVRLWEVVYEESQRLPHGSNGSPVRTAERLRRLLKAVKDGEMVRDDTLLSMGRGSLGDGDADVGDDHLTAQVNDDETIAIRRRFSRAPTTNDLLDEAVAACPLLTSRSIVAFFIRLMKIYPREKRKRTARERKAPHLNGYHRDTTSSNDDVWETGLLNDRRFQLVRLKLWQLLMEDAVIHRRPPAPLANGYRNGHGKSHPPAPSLPTLISTTVSIAPHQRTADTWQHKGRAMLAEQRRRHLGKPSSWRVGHLLQHKQEEEERRRREGVKTVNGTFAARDVAMCAWSLARLHAMERSSEEAKEGDQLLLQAAGTYVIGPRIDGYCAADLSQLSWAYGNLKVASPRFFRCVVDRMLALRSGRPFDDAAASPPDFSPTCMTAFLCGLLYAFMALPRRSLPSQLAHQTRKLIDAFMAQASRQLPAFSARELANFTWALEGLTVIKDEAGKNLLQRGEQDARARFFTAVTHEFFHRVSVGGGEGSDGGQAFSRTDLAQLFGALTAAPIDEHLLKELAEEMGHQLDRLADERPSSPRAASPSGIASPPAPATPPCAPPSIFPQAVDHAPMLNGNQHRGRAPRHVVKGTSDLRDRVIRLGAGRGLVVANGYSGS
ncbi:unnamed protein product [Vitrella brassicaformis CCMP3155]|uniref:ELMO domain-containing protein n=2 Tax=Vitrella brassicaformis TaxID=1169539 RepID=A0A0G4G705_VITBC|nr:unnamed protein product [Vitrella brassicaformis CCMP3155]|mmetsp:Transcript_18030/g.51285  ORF Transcript_18030/g.51285 Transcript_18030/m.51285 type:complete len:750 (-) Transcript_18030:377-2626(-)|eukprot:CEM23998.1 unnamed protein product [Vitrella brassicaformis CCMP3155]